MVRGVFRYYIDRNNSIFLHALAYLFLRRNTDESHGEFPAEDALSIAIFDCVYHRRGFAADRLFPFELVSVSLVVAAAKRLSAPPPFLGAIFVFFMLRRCFCPFRT